MTVITSRFLPTLIEVKGETVYVYNIDAHLFLYMAKKVFSTERVKTYLFKKSTHNRLEIPLFFIRDFYEFAKRILHELTTNKDYARFPRRVKKDIKDILTQFEQLPEIMRLSKTYLPHYNLKLLDTMHWKPLPHQQNFLDDYSIKCQRYGNNALLLNGAAGSGKTAASLFLAELEKCVKVVIVCPLPVINKVWVKTVESIYKNPVKAWSSKDENTPMNDRYRHYICHYEALGSFYTNYRAKPSEKTIIILDESHNFNDLKSNRTKLFTELCKKIRPAHLLFLSGTPFKAKATEIVPTYRCVYPVRFTLKIEERFKRLYGGNVNSTTGILRKRLEELMFTIEKKEIQTIPPISSTIDVRPKNVKPFLLSSVRDDMIKFIKERTAYYDSIKQETHKDFYDILGYYNDRIFTNHENAEYAEYRYLLQKVIKSGGGFGIDTELFAQVNKFEKEVIIPALDPVRAKRFKEVKSIVKYVHLKVRGECLGNVFTKARIDSFIAIAEELDFKKIVEQSEKKVVIFTSYVEVGKKILDRLHKLGMNAISVFGENTKDLNKTVDRFNKDSSANPLVTTYKSLGTGVPLIAANTAVFIDIPFREYIMTQATARVDRIGQDTQTYFIYTKLDTGEEDNIAERSKDIMQWAADQVEGITGISSTISFESTL